MDEYLSEKEQIERIKEWWRENGWFLVGGVALAGLGYFGWNQFQAYQQRNDEAAGALYRGLALAVEDDSRDEADRLLAELAADHESSGYLDQARLLVARDNLVRDTERAIRELTAVVEQSDDEGMIRIARLRLARVLAYAGQYDRALEVLNVPEPGQFEANFAEVRGDIHAAMGNTDAAISAYTDALLGAGGGTVNTTFVQLKLTELTQRAASEPTPETDAAVTGEEG